MIAPEIPAGRRKAATLMVLLGEDAASHIYRQLPQAEVEQIDAGYRRSSTMSIRRLL